MKERIIDALTALAHHTDQSLLESVKKETGLTDQVVAERAKRTLGMILHDYSGFSVSTIDSFFAKMVRAMSRELQLTFGYNLELDTTSVIDEISNRLFDDIASDQQLREWLMAYVMDKIEADKHWNIEQEVQNIAKTLFTEEFRTIFPDGDIKPSPTFIASLQGIIQSFSRQLKDMARQIVEAIEREGLLFDDFYYSGQGFITTIYKIADKGYYPKLEFGVRYTDLMVNPTKWAKKKSPNEARVVSLAQSTLANSALELKNYYDENFIRFMSASSVMEFAYMSGIIGVLDDKLRGFREDENMVMLSDHNLMLRKSMEHNDTEFIYEKTGNRYTHFMLDEFQDTSGFQWNNLFPLVHNAVAQGQYTLIVGDPKQSIYRWRGSNMELLRTNVLKDLSAFSQVTKTQTLSTNYRSLRRIIDFNNRFFVLAPGEFFPAGSQPTNGHPYENPSDVEQGFHHGADGEGFIRFRFFDSTSSEENETEDESEEGNEQEGDSSWLDKADEETLKTIRNLIEKGFNHRDIAILVRNNNHAQRIAGYLIANGIIRITSPESMQLNRSERVLLIINLFRLLVKPDDMIALAQVLMNNPFSGEEESIQDRIGNRKTRNLSKLPKAFVESMTMLKRLPLYEAFERIAVMFRITERPDAYLQRFADVILEFSSKQPVGIADFLDWWEDNQDRESCSVITPSGMDSIRIMTIHKSKGLQFPVVIMPYVSWKAESDQKSSIWVHSEEEPFDSKPAHIVKVKKSLKQTYFESDYDREIMMSRLDNMNLLYVAFTRAEEQLHVFSKNFKSNKEQDQKKWSPEASKLIFKILRRNKEWSDNLDHHRALSEQNGIDDGWTMEWGVMTGPIKRQKSPGASPEPLQHWISEPWQDRIRMLINKDRISSTDKVKPDPTYGIHFHTLATVADGSISADTLVNSYCQSNTVDDVHKVRLVKDLQLFLDTARQNGWFDPAAETWNEQELLLADGKVLRPDRLILKGNKAVVVDYKTGDEDPSHAKQVTSYGDVLKEMGYTETELFLFYPALEKTVSISN